MEEACVIQSERLQMDVEARLFGQDWTFDPKLTRWFSDFSAGVGEGSPGQTDEPGPGSPGGATAVHTGAAERGNALSWQRHQPIRRPRCLHLQHAERGSQGGAEGEEEEEEEGVSARTCCCLCYCHVTVTTCSLSNRGFLFTCLCAVVYIFVFVCFCISICHLLFQGCLLVVYVLLFSC